MEVKVLSIDAKRWKEVFRNLGIRVEGKIPPIPGKLTPHFYLPDFGWWIYCWTSIVEMNECQEQLLYLWRRTKKPIVCLAPLEFNPKNYRKPKILIPSPVTMTGDVGSIRLPWPGDPDFWNPDNLNSQQTYSRGWGAQFLCPICRDEYVHFGEPIHKSSDDYKAWDGRGSAIVVPMSCESGHCWDLRIGFHKGYSFLAVENIEEVIQEPLEILTLGKGIDFMMAVEEALKKFPFGEGEASPTPEEITIMFGLKKV